MTYLKKTIEKKYKAYILCFIYRTDFRYNPNWYCNWFTDDTMLKNVIHRTISFRIAACLD